MTSDEKRPPRVLVVDDSRDNADSLALLLHLSGYDTHPAYSGASAMNYVRAYHPDCVISDINMPGMDGCELARRVRAECVGVKLIALSGRSDAEHVRRTQEAGFDHQFTKPVAPSALLEVLAVMKQIKDLAEQTQTLTGETKQLLTEVKETVQEVKAEVQELKQEVKELKEEVKEQRQGGETSQ
jgi:CheY-like chemotaxis protein